MISREHLGQFAIAANMGFTRGILLLDDCEGTLGWSASGTGGDQVVAYATAAAWVGTKGLHLGTRATNPAEDDNIHAGRTLEWAESGLLAFRFRFASPDISDVKHVTFIVNKDDGSDAYLAEVDYVVGTSKVQYRSGTDSWVETAIVPGNIADKQWTLVELIVDLTLHKWVSLRMFGQKVDLSAVDMWFNEGSGSFKGVLVDLMVIAAGANQAEGYFDQIYVGEHVAL